MMIVMLMVGVCGWLCDRPKEGYVDVQAGVLVRAIQDPIIVQHCTEEKHIESSHMWYFPPTCSKLRLSSIGKICWQDLLPVTSSLQSLSYPHTIKSRQSQLHQVLFQPTQQLQLQIYRYIGTPSISITICSTSSIKACYHDTQQSELSPMFSWFEEVKLDYCGSCVVVVRVGCESPVCEVMLGGREGVISLRYLEYGDGIGYGEVPEVRSVYGEAKMDGRELSLQDGYDKGLFIIDNGSNQSQELYDGIPVHRPNHYHYQTISEPIFIIIQPIPTTNLTISYTPTNQTPILHTFQNLPHKVAIATSASDNYNFSLQSGYLHMHSTAVINILLDHHYPSITTYHHPKQYLLHSIQHVYIYVRQCTRASLRLKYWYDGSEQEVMMLGDVVSVVEVKLRKEVLVWVEVWANQYAVYDLYVKRSSQKAINVTEVQRVQVTGRNVIIEYASQQPLYPSFYAGEEQDSLTRSTLCHNILFYADSYLPTIHNITSTCTTTTHNRTHTHQCIFNGIPTEPYLTITLRDKHDNLHKYRTIRTAQGGNWKAWAVGLVTMIMVLMIWVKKNVYASPKHTKTQ